jgi:hypothetical protein
MANALNGVLAVITAGAIVGTNAVKPSASETILADDGLFIYAKNTSSTAVNLVLVDGGNTAAGTAGVGVTIAVPITSGELLVAVPKALVAPATGLITVTFSAQPTGLVAAWYRR